MTIKPNKQMNQKELLSKKLDILFPDIAARKDAIDILSEYRQEGLRVKLAILKLSGSDLDKIIDLTDTAKHDYRDILSWAEYPRQSKNWSIPDGDKKQQLVEQDSAEYQEWLNS